VPPVAGKSNVPSVLRVAPLLVAIGGLPLPVETYARNEALKPQSRLPPATLTGAANAGVTPASAVAAPRATAVAFTGIISFVGLVVPHLIRMVAGPGHRVLIPASALGGAVVVVTADLIARTAIDYQELPLGVLTAVVGGPVFFWLLRRTRSRAGGWG
jgi:hypothetical protein